MFFLGVGAHYFPPKKTLAQNNFIYSVLGLPMSKPCWPAGFRTCLITARTCRSNLWIFKNLSAIIGVLFEYLFQNCVPYDSHIFIALLSHLMSKTAAALYAIFIAMIIRFTNFRSVIVIYMKGNGFVLRLPLPCCKISCGGINASRNILCLGETVLSFRRSPCWHKLMIFSCHLHFCDSLQVNQPLRPK